MKNYSLLTLGVCLGLLYLLSVSGTVGGDAWVSFLSAKSLVELGRWDIPLEWLPPTTETIVYSKYSVFWTLLMVPFFAVGAWLASLMGASVDVYEQLTQLTVSVMPVGIALLGVFVFYGLLNTLYGSSKLNLALAFVFGTATMVWPYVQPSFVDLFGMVALTTFVWMLFRWRKDPSLTNECWLAGLGFLLIAIKSCYILCIPSAYIYAFCLKHWRIRFYLWVALGVVAGIAFTLLLNRLRWGSFFNFQYGMQFAWQYYKYSVPGFTLSLHKSFFIYNLPLVVSLWGIRSFWRHNRYEMVVVVYMSLVLFLLFGAYLAWHAGICWGPRYLLLLVPLWLIWARELWREGMTSLVRKLFVVSALLGTIVSFLGVVTLPFRWDLLMHRSLFPDREQRAQMAWTHAEYSSVYGSICLFASQMSRVVTGDSLSYLLADQVVPLDKLDESGVAFAKAEDYFPFFQTWFKILCWLCLIGILIFIYWLVIRIMLVRPF